jgi:hypothetical protein
MMSTLPEIFLFPLSLSSGTGGEKEERGKRKRKIPELTSLPVAPSAPCCALDFSLGQNHAPNYG